MNPEDELAEAFADIVIGGISAQRHQRYIKLDFELHLTPTVFELYDLPYDTIQAAIHHLIRQVDSVKIMYSSRAEIIAEVRPAISRTFGGTRVRSNSPILIQSE